MLFYPFVYQAWAFGRCTEERPSFCSVGRPNGGLLAWGRASHSHILTPCSRYSDDYNYINRTKEMMMKMMAIDSLLSHSCGLECRHGTLRLAVPTWRVVPSCLRFLTQRSRGRLASVTHCTGSSSGWPSRRWCHSPVPQHRSPHAP